jgi:hypothetical protein
MAILMTAPRLKEIMDHAEVLFKPEQISIREQHEADLKAAEFKARKTGNSAAMFPAEAECYLAHIKALVIAKANCLANAYTAFNEPSGHEADAELSRFFAVVVAARKSSFVGHTDLVGLRTSRSTTQVPYLVQSFERNAKVALLEGERILDIQRLQMKNKPPSPPNPAPHNTHIYNANVQGPNARVTIAGTDNSSNTVVISGGLFRRVEAELENEVHLLDKPVREELIARLHEIEHSPSKAIAGEKFALFLSLAANYATVYTALKPYIDQFAAWISTHHFTF